MGSEHYCLRWNNHQSNLLGVFSQLLQDESLVDVTLACSEGAPIRAHKVVLSACSSYFQSLFLDHPEKHPIVILKDVRFAELQTLVEFMYKGEVNVQYCQLSALLKTAESLKVKGLAEMTNQNTTLREPEREPDRLRPQSQPGKSTCDSPDVDDALAGPSAASTSSSISSAGSGTSVVGIAATSSTTGTATTSTATTTTTTTTATGTANAAAVSTTTVVTAALATVTATSAATFTTTASSAHKREASERCSASPPKRQQITATTTITTAIATTASATHASVLASSSAAALAAETAEQESPLALDLYQRRAEHEHPADSSERGRTIELGPASSSASGSGSVSAPTSHPPMRSSTPASAHGGSGASGTSNPAINDDDERDLLNSPERPASCSVHDESEAFGGVEKIEDVDDYDEEMDLDDEADDQSSNEVGLNMKINIASVAATHILSSPISGGVTGAGDLESARSTPAISTSSALLLPSDLTQRPASRSSRDGGGSSGAGGVHTGTDRPSSSGIIGLPGASMGALAGSSMSPSSSTANANATGIGMGIGVGIGVGVDSETLTGHSGLGPVQSVPLSLKKEIECSEDDNSSSNSRHMQPRSASAGGGLGGSSGSGGLGSGELDYRASHESETSVSPHGGAGGGGVGGGSGGGGTVSGGASVAGNALLGVGVGVSGVTGGSGGATSSSATVAGHEQPQIPSPMHTCLYCGATFPHQSKLTRHILSHSLKTLEYRESATNPLLHTQMLTHELNMAAQQQFAYQMNAIVGSTDPQEQAAAVTLAAAAMEMDFAAAVVAASGCPIAGLTSCGLDSSGATILGGGGPGGGVDSGSRGRGSSSGNGGGGVGGSSGSGLLLSGSGSSSSTSAAAAAAAAAVASTSSALLGGPSSTDPNSVVLCKFCSKSFPDVASLIAHLPAHTGDRPFKCDYCGKAFKLRHHMKDHCRVHTGERPFRCHLCGKTFSRSTILKAHEKTHFPKYVRKYLSPSPVDTKDELPQ